MHMKMPEITDKKFLSFKFILEIKVTGGSVFLLCLSQLLLHICIWPYFDLINFYLHTLKKKKKTRFAFEEKSGLS